MNFEDILGRSTWDPRYKGGSRHRRERTRLKTVVVGVVWIAIIGREALANLLGVRGALFERY